MKRFSIRDAAISVMVVACLYIGFYSMPAEAKQTYPWGTITELEHMAAKGVMYGLWHASQEQGTKQCFIPDTLAEFYNEVWPIVFYIMNADYSCLGCLGERGTAMQNTYDVINEVYPCKGRIK